VTAVVDVKIVQYSVVAARAVIPVMLTVVPEPEAAKLPPGSKVAFGKYVVQPVLEIDWVVLTVPPLKLLKLTEAVVDPEPTVLKSNTTCCPSLAIIGLALLAPPISRMLVLVKLLAKALGSRKAKLATKTASKSNRIPVRGMFFIFNNYLINF